jgi:hypothetical protein
VLATLYARLGSGGAGAVLTRPAAALSADLGGTIGLGGGALVGVACGSLMESIGEASLAFPAPVLTVAGAVVGAAWGVLLGSIAVSGASAPPPRDREHPTKEPRRPLQRER